MLFTPILLSFSKLSIPTPFNPSYFIYILPCILFSIPLFLDSSSPRTPYTFPEFCGSSTLKTFVILIRHFITFAKNCLVHWPSFGLEHLFYWLVFLSLLNMLMIKPLSGVCWKIYIFIYIFCILFLHWINFFFEKQRLLNLACPVCQLLVFLPT